MLLASTQVPVSWLHLAGVFCIHVKTCHPHINVFCTFMPWIFMCACIHTYRHAFSAKGVVYIYIYIYTHTHCKNMQTQTHIWRYTDVNRHAHAADTRNTCAIHRHKHIHHTYLQSFLWRKNKQKLCAYVCHTHAYTDRCRCSCWCSLTWWRRCWAPRIGICVCDVLILTSAPVYVCMYLCAYTHKYVYACV